MLLVLLAACAAHEPATTVTVPAATPGPRASTASALTARPSQEERRAAADAHRIFGAVAHWREGHEDECPTVERATGSAAVDPWGQPYKVQCGDTESIVVSFGPDRREGTSDDITASATE